MTHQELPADVRRFVLTSIPSVPYLEAVLLLRGEPQEAWEVTDFARRLYVSDRTAADLVQQLRDGGVAETAGESGGIRYAPAAELKERLDALAHWYTVDLVTITQLIHSRIDRRAQQFADAFRIRKE